MLTLGIETSGRDASIALRRDDVTLAERSLSHSGQRHAQTLVTEIDQGLRELGLGPRDCQIVAVSIGPGSFTGLRIGVVCAKTLAYATGCSLAAIDTFAAIAQNSPDDVDRVCVVADAQRQDLYCGSYRRDGAGRFVSEGPIEIVQISQWLVDRTPADIVTGPGLTKVGSQLTRDVRQLPELCWKPQAAQIAELGASRCQVHGPDDFWKLEPFYLRKSAAEEKREAQERGAGIGQPL